MKALTKSKVYEANPGWFSSANAHFFGDVRYEWANGGMSGDLYLLRETSMWSDMFGKKKKYFWRINCLDQLTGKILSLTDDIFNTEEEAQEWLKQN
ncbi:MAG: hypothetical protein MUP81_03210 [Dehalococcoidia bacterium]|nr:hypothetical protein [Dehalococcoidia bacterium]